MIEEDEVGLNENTSKRIHQNETQSNTSVGFIPNFTIIRNCRLRNCRLGGGELHTQVDESEPTTQRAAVHRRTQDHKQLAADFGRVFFNTGISQFM